MQKLLLLVTVITALTLSTSAVANDAYVMLGVLGAPILIPLIYATPLGWAFLAALGTAMSLNLAVHSLNDLNSVGRIPVEIAHKEFSSDINAYIESRCSTKLVSPRELTKNTKIWGRGEYYSIASCKDLPVQHPFNGDGYGLSRLRNACEEGKAENFATYLIRQAGSFQRIANYKLGEQLAADQDNDQMLSAVKDLAKVFRDLEDRFHDEAIRVNSLHGDRALKTLQFYFEKISAVEKTWSLKGTSASLEGFPEEVLQSKQIQDLSHRYLCDIAKLYTPSMNLRLALMKAEMSFRKAQKEEKDWTSQLDRIRNPNQ